MSDSNPWTRAARIWIADAAEDLTAATSGLQQIQFMKPRQVGFFAQQAAEKALKGALTFARSADMEPTHDLTYLVNALPSDGTWSTRQKYSDLADLTRMAAQARYLINDEPVSERQAHTACALAAGIYKSCLADMVAHGFRIVEPG